MQAKAWGLDGIDWGFDNALLPPDLQRLEPHLELAAKSLPKPDFWIFVCLEKHIREHGLDQVLYKYFPGAEIIKVDYLTEGQASTCLLAKDLRVTRELVTDHTGRS